MWNLPDPLLTLVRAVGIIVVWAIGFTTLERSDRTKVRIHVGDDERDG